MSYLSANHKGGLIWGQKLIVGTLLKRHKRFLAEVRLVCGKEVTAHTPNTGSMRGCSEPGSLVYLTYHDKPTRKLKYTLEIVVTPLSWVGVNTFVPNKLVAEAFRKSMVKNYEKWNEVATEVTVSSKSRLDLKLSALNELDIYVEVKNCTLVEDKIALFPDAPTVRGLKHLEELSELCAQGHRALLFVLIQRHDANFFSPADKIDPKWGEGLRKAKKNGVEILAYQAKLTLAGIDLAHPLEIKL